MKKYRLLFTGALFLTAALAKAGDFTADGITYDILTESTVAVSASESGYSGKIEIPATVENEGVTYSVTAIADEAFTYSGVTEVSIPEGVVSIGKGAFAGSYLASIKLPDSLETLGEAAFQGCFSATSLSLGSGIRDIPGGCFMTCMYLEEIIIPDQVETIGPSAFQGCGFSAKKLTLGSGLKRIAPWAFYNFRNITSLTFPEGLLEIGDCSFEQCDGLTEVYIPASVETIGYGPISGRGMRKYTVAPENPNYVSYNDALYSKDLTLLIEYPEARPGQPAWPENLREIGTNACARATFSELRLPETVEIIGDAAFYASSTIRKISLPAAVKAIGTTAFYGNEALEEIDWNGSSATTVGDMAFAYCWKNLTEVVIPDGMETVGDGMFYGCDNLKTVSYPSTLRTIGSNIFNYCPRLEKVNFAEGLTEMGQDIFYECKSLKELIIPNSVKTVGQGLCFACSGLETLVIGSGLVVIPEYAFSGCTGLKSVKCISRVPPKNADFPIEAYDNATLYVPEGRTALYRKSPEGWDRFLNIEEFTESGVLAIGTEGISCRLENGEVIVNGADNSTVEVYDLQGRLLYRGTANRIPVAPGGVIVKCGKNIFKLI